jgi:Catalytic LigB subunit of aromatic ring-opening dioxygenase
MDERFAGAFAASHSPGITGFPQRAEPGARERVDAGYAELRRRVAASGARALVCVSVEHFTNFFLGNLPAFAIGTADGYLGPVTAQMGEFLRIPQRTYAGAAALGAHLYRYALDHDFDPSLVAGDHAFDENFCVPLHRLDPDATLPVVPIIVNAVNPPYPTPRRCYDFGAMLREAIEAQDVPAAVLATGGLSHWVGMPEAGQINEAFDRDFLDRLGAGDRSRLIDYTDEQIDAAGNGAHEIRTWLVAAGAAGRPFETLAYEPVPAWLTGTAVAAARA